MQDVHPFRVSLCRWTNDEAENSVAYIISPIQPLPRPTQMPGTAKFKLFGKLDDNHNKSSRQPLTMTKVNKGMSF
jgi:hypothetical protein